MFKWIEMNKLLRRLADGATIPADAANADYRDALAWVELGNVIPEPDAPTPAEVAEQARLAELDTQISESATLAALKAMTNAEFNAWWALNVTNLAQANTVLKLLSRLAVRRLL